MTSKFDYRDLLTRYVGHVKRIERGDDLLGPDTGAPFTSDEIAALRGLTGVFNPTLFFSEVHCIPYAQTSGQ